MSDKDSPDGGYRTLVPGQGPKPVPKAPAKPPAAPPAASKPPVAPAPQTKPEAEKPHDDPTRFGDWEVKGRCIDF